MTSQTDVFEDPDASPAAQWLRDAARHALDDLFTVAGRYRDTKDFKDLLDFTIRFRAYSPFNAMLLHIQMAGAQFVAPASRWRRDYGRRIKRGERPLVILQPMGPVMFVFDLAQTEPDAFGAREIPSAVLNPFTVVGAMGEQLELTIKNCARDGVGVQFIEQGSQGAGLVQCVIPGEYILFETKGGPQPEYLRVARTYDIQLNRAHNRPTSYATLVHELAHLYCGHLGTPNPAWWPDRRGMEVDTCEFEAESVSYLVCRRLGIETPSASYLSNYAKSNEQTPSISLDRVMASAGLVEQMGKIRLKPRPENKSGD
ncbi:MAG: hypothetical protein ACREPM_05225 [Gemmatimonadaceae bacterium]